MRIAILGLFHESNTFAEHATLWSDFTDYDWYEGDALRKAMADSNNEMGGMLAVLDEAGADVEAVPVLYAAALPAGRITEDAEERLWRAASDALAEAGPIDGVLAAPHGAAVGRAHPDFDGWWLGRLRELVGPTVPIVATLDPHANVSSAMVAATDALLAYRTNPHVDQRAVGRRAAELILGQLRGQVDLDCAWVSLPMVLNIERQLTDDTPCRDWLEKGQSLASADGVLATSLILGYPYADVAEMGLGVLVVTNRRVSSTRAQQVAKDWAGHIWADRELARPELVAMDTAARAAADAKDVPAGLLDMGDNIGGGSYGDQTALAHAAILHGALPLFVALSDAESFKACVAAGIGGDVDLQVGGR
ncbi:MAG: M81 family metallopeptidase, partial [Planctomycetota bacterium]